MTVRASSDFHDEALSRTAVMRAGVWPTIVALVVAAVLIIERLQVDWTVSCKLVSGTPETCPNFYEQLFSLLLPSFAFALAHIVGAAGLHVDGGTRPALWERAGKLAAFFAISVFPSFGWYLFYVGLARLSHCKSLSRLIVALGARRRQRAQSGVAAGAGWAGSTMVPSVG
jgi:hypothetical protein